MIPKIIKVREGLEGKWHHEKHDMPKIYEDIVVETYDGEFLDGYLTDSGMFHPYDIGVLERLKAVHCKRWKYGMIDKKIGL